jgi:hypothetical protein
MTDRPEPQSWWRLPRIRLSVRALMLLILVFGCWLSWYVRRVQVQRDAVAAIERAGGTVAYDWEWGNYNPHILDYTGKPRVPKWLASRVGVDYVANVVHVSLVPHRAQDQNRADDETLAHVGRLGRLEFLSLNNTAVTDAGLVHLRGLTTLRNLELWHTQVGDAGLAQLKGMANLRLMTLAGTRVTDDGVLAIEEALPKLQIHREEDMAFTENVRRAMDDLDFARSRPIRLACSLLVHRATFMAGRNEKVEFVATVNALCELEANDKVSLFRVAQARAECLSNLEPGRSPSLSDSERRALRQRCSDRGIAALTRAIEQGYRTVRRLGGEPREFGRMRLWNLRNHPDFPKLVARMKTIRPAR